MTGSSLKLGILLVNLFLVQAALAATVSLTGTINDITGNGVSGTLYLSLPAPAQDPSTGVAIAPGWVAYRLVNGAITGSAKVYDVSTINPSGLYYIARAYDTAGNLVFSGNYNIVGPGSFNLGTAVPTSVTTSNISYLAPATTNGNNTFTGLNSHSGLETFTGGVNLQSAPGIVAGIFNGGTGFQHIRVASCTTAAGANSVCSTTVTWNTAFADTNYTPVCTWFPSSTAGAYLSHITTKVAASITVEVDNGASGGATSGPINCIAVHD